MTDFLQMPNKLSSEKRRQINKSKQKINIEETNLVKTTITSLDSFHKKELPVSILTTKKSDIKAKKIDIVMIGKDIYYAAFRLKRVQVFALLMRDIQYQAEKKTIAETNLRSIVP